MVSTNIIGIIGLIFTILLGAPALYIIIKNRYPGQITLIKETSLALFDSLIKSFPEFSIHYKNNSINEGLVFLRGALLNTGKKDIDETMIKKKLTIDLPKDYKWISAKIIASSPDFTSTATITDNKIEFTTGLFRCKEFFRFEALVEIPITEAKKDKKHISLEEKLDKGMHISHRIADTQEVVVKDLPNPKQGGKQLRSLQALLVCLVITIVTIIAMPTIIFLKGWPVKTLYTIKDDEGKNIKIEVKGMRQGKVRIRGVTEKKFQKVMPIADFLNQPQIKFNLECDKEIKIIFFVLLLYVLIISGMCVAIYREHREGKKFRKLLSIT